MWNMGESNTSDHIQIIIRVQNPSQEHPVSYKAQNQDLKDMDVLCTLKIKIESQNSEYGCTKDQWPYPNQDQDANPQSGTSSVLQSSICGLKGQGCSLRLQNQDREPKFESQAYQRPVTIYKSRSRFQTSARNLQCPQKDKSRILEHGYSLQFQNLFRQSKFWTYINYNQDAKYPSGTSNLFNLRLIIAELSLFDSYGLRCLSTNILYENVITYSFGIYNCNMHRTAY